MIVRENISFQRTRNTKSSLNLGIEGYIKEKELEIQVWKINKEGRVDCWGYVDGRGNFRENTGIYEKLPDFMKFGTIYKNKEEVNKRTYFTVAGCSLISFEGMPQKVHGSFYGGKNYKLESLKGGPIYIEGEYHIDECPIKSLEGFPKYIGGDFFAGPDFPFTEEEVRKVCTIRGKVNISRPG